MKHIISLAIFAFVFGAFVIHTSSVDAVTKANNSPVGKPCVSNYTCKFKKADVSLEMLPKGVRNYFYCNEDKKCEAKKTLNKPVKNKKYCRSKDADVINGQLTCTINSDLCDSSTGLPYPGLEFNIYHDPDGDGMINLDDNCDCQSGDTCSLPSTQRK